MTTALARMKHHSSAYPLLCLLHSVLCFVTTVRLRARVWTQVLTPRCNTGQNEECSEAGRVSDKVPTVFNVPKQSEVFLVCLTTARKVSMAPTKKMDNIHPQDGYYPSSRCGKMDNGDKRWIIETSAPSEAVAQGVDSHCLKKLCF